MKNGQKSEKKVILYTMEYCPYCVRAKQLLTQRNVPFDLIQVDEDNDAEWERLHQLSGMRTMPQIFFGEKLIGGFTELSKLDAEDKLASLK